MMREELEAIARRMTGAAIQCDAADAHFDRLHVWFKGWSAISTRVSYDLRGEPASLDSLVEYARRLHNSDQPILIVPHHMTEDVLQIRPEDLKAVMEALLPLPSGWAIGPADWRWLLEVKFIGTAYCAAAPDPHRLNPPPAPSP